MVYQQYSGGIVVTAAVIITSTLIGYVFFAKYEFKREKGIVCIASGNDDGATTGKHDSALSDDSGNAFI